MPNYDDSNYQNGMWLYCMTVKVFAIEVKDEPIFHRITCQMIILLCSLAVSLSLASGWGFTPDHLLTLSRKGNLKQLNYIMWRDRQT
jgi:hypothetical protein